MFRFISLVLSLAMFGCAQHVTPFAQAGAQSAMPNAVTVAAKPAQSVVAHVAFKNEAYNDGGNSTEFTVYWSYAANPIWHVEVRACLKPGDSLHADVVYNHIKSGPQIMFSAEAASRELFQCSLFRAGHRTVAFHSMIFDPNAHFETVYRFNERERGESRYTLCARGGGNKEVCDPR